jgi:hypothetical protein
VESSGSADSFVVDLNGVKLSDAERAQLAGAIQGATLSALARFDSRGDLVALALPTNGHTQGIHIYDGALLESRLPDLRKTVEDISGGR